MRKLPRLVYSVLLVSGITYFIFIITIANLSVIESSEVNKKHRSVVTHTNENKFESGDAAANNFKNKINEPVEMASLLKRTARGELNNTEVKFAPIPTNLKPNEHKTSYSHETENITKLKDISNKFNEHQTFKRVEKSQNILHNLEVNSKNRESVEEKINLEMLVNKFLMETRTTPVDSKNNDQLVLSNSSKLFNENNFETSRIFKSTEPEMRISRNRKCRKPRDHVFFLKTHKCGSSTVQNILMRWGLDRNLDFVLPSIGNYLGSPEPFNPVFHIGNSVRTSDDLYDIFTHHTRYQAANVKSVMHPDTFKFTIVREPAAQFESMFTFFSLSSQAYFGLSLNQLLKATTSRLTRFFNFFPRTTGRIGINQVSYDLGLDPSDFDNHRSITKLISRVDREFELVMLAEHMEASLVLLSHKLCWPLHAVTFISLNSRNENFKATLSREDRKKLRQVNHADYMIYLYFRAKFRRQLQEYGEYRMQYDVKRLVDMNQQIYRQCVKETGSCDSKVKSSELRNEAPDYCRYYTMHENNFTDILRREQEYRHRVIDNLDRFLHHDD